MASKSIGMGCVSNAQNTGKIECPAEMGLIIGAVFLPIGKSYTPEQTVDGATFYAALQADARNNTKGLRVYPFGNFENAESTGAEAQVETSGYGNPRTTLDAKLGYNFTIWEGGKCYNTKLASFSKKQSSYTIVFYDSNGVYWGTQDANGNFLGYSMSNLYITPYTFPTASTGGSFMVQVALSNGYIESVLNWAAIGTGLAFASGLNDITLSNTTAQVLPAPAVGVYYIQVKAGCSNTSLLPIYNTNLDVITQGTVWNSANATDGGVISITSITYNSTYDALIFTFDTADADWTLGEDVLLTMTNVTGLVAAGVIGYEANPNSIVLPN